MKTILVVGGIGIGVIIMVMVWKRYKEQLALEVVMQNPRDITKMGLDTLVDAKVNQGLNKGIDFVMGKIGL